MGYSNPGRVDFEAARDGIVNAGGGYTEKENYHGSGMTHCVAYSTDSNRHLSADRDSDGNYHNIHTDKDNSAYIDYKD